MAARVPLQTIEGWLFDLDGTLIDMGDWVISRIAARFPFLGEKCARALARKMVIYSDVPLNKLAGLLRRVDREEWLSIIRGWFSRDQLPIFPLIPGVRPLLAYLAERRVLAVVTSRSQEDAEKFLTTYELAKFIPLLVSEETVLRLKPHPEPILTAVRALDLSPSLCAMVGDMPVDMQAAQDAGVWAVGVLCGVGRREELERAGAQLILETTADLLPLLRGGGAPFSSAGQGGRGKEGAHEDQERRQGVVDSVHGDGGPDGARQLVDERVDDPDDKTRGDDRG